MIKGKSSGKIRIASGRSCCVVGTLQALAKSLGCTEEQVVAVLKERIMQYPRVLHYAGIVHDKDRNELSHEKISTHVHIVVEFKNDVEYRTFASVLGITEQSVEKIKQKRLYGQKRVSDLGGALSYLTHRNAPEKHQYDDSEVFASEGWDWKARRTASEKSRKSSELGWIIEKIHNGEITESNFINFLDPETYIKYSKEIKLAFEYYNKQLALNHDRDMIVIYIQGDKGTGKTTLAKAFCEKLQLTYLVTGGSNDPFEGYAGQKAVIVDDARPDMFSADEWLKILDNNTQSLARSRYHNRNIVADYIILTSTINLMDFFDSYTDEDPQQLYRRIKLWYVVGKEFIEIYEYRNEEGRYAKIMTSRNWIRQKYGNPDLTAEKKASIIEGFGLSNCISEKTELETSEKKSIEEKEEATIDIDFTHETVTREGKTQKVEEFQKTIFEVMNKCFEEVKNG